MAQQLITFPSPAEDLDSGPRPTLDSSQPPLTPVLGDPTLLGSLTCTGPSRNITIYIIKNKNESLKLQIPCEMGSKNIFKT